VTVSPLATPAPPGTQPSDPALPDLGTAPLPLPPPIVVAGDGRLSSVSAVGARAIVRAAARKRLRHWRLSSVTCRVVSRRQAACRLRARRGGRRITASGTVTLSSTGRSLGYRLTVRRVAGPRRTSRWSGRSSVSVSRSS
jgi:hypothetical protein